MIDQYVRTALPRFVRPLIAFYTKNRIHPNTITLAGFGLASLAAFAVALDFPLLALSLWWFSRFLDGTDGILARQCGTASPFGAYLDIVLDMAAYSLMIVGFAHLHPDLNTLWLFTLLMYVLCITSALTTGSLEKDQIQIPLHGIPAHGADPKSELRALDQSELRALESPVESPVHGATFKKDNRGVRLAVGLAEGGETGMAYTLFLLFPGYIKFLSLLWLVILVITVVARAMIVRKIPGGQHEAKDRGDKERTDFETPDIPLP